MIHSKIWIGFVLVISSAFAQQNSKGRVTLHVSDPTRALIPGAQVSVETTEHAESMAAKTDIQGTAILDLSPGSYEIAVMAPGFESWRSQIEVAGDRNQIITVKLSVGRTGNPIVVQEPPRLGPESPPILLLSAKSLASLPSLPARTPKKRH